MQAITSVKELRKVILLLEDRQALQGRAMKEQFFIVVESVKPINILKRTINEAASSPDLISNMLRATIGLATGYLSDKILEGSSENLFKKLLGTLIKFGATNLLVSNKR